MSKEVSRIRRWRAVADLVEVAGKLPPASVVVAGGDRVEDLRLAESARDHGIVERVILVGRAERIEAAVEEAGIEIDTGDIRGTADDDATAAATVDLIQAGHVNMVCKGNISTPIINRHMLPLAIRPTVSLVTLFDADPISGGRPMIMTDAGVTTVCSYGRMVDLIENAVDVAHVVMGIEKPRVAVLSANEKQVPSMASTALGAALAERAWQDCVVYGPLSFDLATDPYSVSVKGLKDKGKTLEVAGQADVLVCPNIDAANVLYKNITAMIKYGQASMANITAGFPVPYLLLSRADSLDTKLYSIAMSSIYAHYTRQQEMEKPVSVTLSGQGWRILAVNPGSTSIKLAVYEGASCVLEHEAACDIQISGSQKERRAQVDEITGIALQVLQEQPVDAVVGRGGFLPRPAGKLQSGTYAVATCQDGAVKVDEGIVSAVLERPELDHASNFGIPVAAALARSLKVPAYTVDPVVVDEFIPEAEISGLKAITRRSTSHALSIRAASRKAAEAVGRAVEDCNFVVAHLGGGMTVAAVCKGRMIDNTMALLGGGPFTPQRAGELPSGDLIDLCYSGRYTREELIRMLTKEGGMRSYLGNDDMIAIEAQVEAGDEKATALLKAMNYQIIKAIGSMMFALGNDVEAVVLTGGLARCKPVVYGVRKGVGRFAPVMVFKESLEMAALADGAMGVLEGKTTLQRYVAPVE